MSYQVNVPYGINLMANTSVLAVSIPMTPITLAFGPHIAFNVFLTGALLLTGVSWYYVLSRHIVTSKVAAWVARCSPRSRRAWWRTPTATPTSSRSS